MTKSIFVYGWQTICKIPYKYWHWDILIEPVEKITGEDWLEFAGISPAIIYDISKEQQFAIFRIYD
jgi:hypothetical protein